MRLIDADKVMKLIPTEEYNARIAIAYAPTIDAEPIRHGEWISDERSYTIGETWCSVCKAEYYIDDLYDVSESYTLPMYCPNCGARMDGDDA